MHKNDKKQMRESQKEITKKVIREDEISD